MNLPKATWTLTLALLCTLPLALIAGCTGPLPGTGAANNTNTSDAIGLDDASLSEGYSNTTN